MHHIQKMTERRVILASASPRRDELLNLISLPHEILVTNADETPAGEMPEGSGLSPAGWYAASASIAKAEAAEKEVFGDIVSIGRHDGRSTGGSDVESKGGPDVSPTGSVIIIAADTVVSVDGTEVFGKPRDAADAARMLRALSGSEHFVIGGITVSDGSRRVIRCVTTTVRMKRLSDGDIAAYIATGEPFGKAGAYAIQGRGAVLVDSITGDYGNVVGISTSVLRDILKFDFSAEIL